MKQKKKKRPLILFFCIFAAGVAGSLLMLRRPDTREVEIVRDQEVLYRIDLNGLAGFFGADCVSAEPSFDTLCGKYRRGGQHSRVRINRGEEV